MTELAKPISRHFHVPLATRLRCSSWLMLLESEEGKDVDGD